MKWTNYTNNFALDMKVFSKTGNRDDIVQINRNRTGLLRYILSYPYLSIFILAAIVWLQTISFDFIKFDDDYFLNVSQDKVEKITGLKTALTGNYLDSYYYRPLTNLTFMIDWKNSGVNPLAFHLTNLLIHVIACLLMFGLMRKLKFSKEASFVIAGLFAVHPLLANSISWVVGRNDMLAGLFGAAALISFINYFEKRRTIWLISHSVLLLLAMYSKETALALPLIMMIYWLLYQWKDKNTSKIATIILSLGGAYALYLVSKFTSVNPGFNEPNFNLGNFLINLRQIPETIGKAFLPVNISGVETFNDISLIIGLAITALILTITVVKRKQADLKIIILGAAIFLVYLLPGLFVRLKDAGSYFDYIDCRSYLPLVGLLLIAAEILRNLRIDLNKNATLLFSLSVIFLFGIISIAGSKQYKNAVTFWERSAGENPDRVMTQGKIGQILFRESEYQKAIGYLMKSVEKYPAIRTSADHINFADLAAAQFKIGNLNLAPGFMEKSAQINKNDPTAWLALGFYYSQTGDYYKAVDASKRSLRIDPNYIDAFKNLFVYYYDNIRNYDSAAVYAFEYEKRGGTINPHVLRFLKDSLKTYIYRD